jgi:hypothetical protein
MLNALFGLAVVFMISSAVALADHTEQVTADRLFVPTGFDDNDHTQVVLDGFFPNSCYQIDEVEVIVHPDENMVHLTPKARVMDGICLNVIVPFTYVAEIGVLPQGNWKVEITTNRLVKDLPIAEAASAGPDDEMYAALENTYIVYDPEARRDVVILEGRYTNSCMRWLESRLIHAVPDVLELRPVVTIDERDDCIDGNFPFEGVKVSLPTLDPGRYLLHARSMNGGALNRVFSVAERPVN